MQRISRHILLTLLLAATLGCWQKATPTTPVAKATPAANIPKDSNPKAPEPEPAPAPKADEKKPETTSPTPAPKPPTPERIALLTPGGPLLVDVHLTVDGEDFNQGVNSQLDKVIAAADTNNDKRHTWKEFIANDAFLKSPLANAENATGAQKYKWAEDYDLNDNDLVERAEAAAWLGRDAGRSARAFSVRSTRTVRPDPRGTSRLWPMLDADNDGKLSAVEIRDASGSLLSRDANDDLTLTAQELLPLRDQLEAADGQQMYGRSNGEHFAALHLEPNEDISRVEYLLNDLYSPRQDLTPASFAALPRLGDELDANEDNWLEGEELAALFKIKPYLELTVSFAKTDAPGGRAATVAIDQHAPEVTILSQSTPSRTVISLGGTPIVLSAHEIAPGYTPRGPYSAGATQDQIRLLVHDQTDAVFAELDANSDARLSEREIKMVRDRLLARDANQDKELADEELPYSMIVAFIRGEAANEQSFYVPASPPAATTGPKPPSWFTHADLNADGEISRREFIGTPDHFSHADLSRDGYITPDEAAQTSAAP